MVKTGFYSIHSLQKQHMKVNIQIQSTAKALDQGHRASLYKGFCKARFMCQVRGDGARDDTQHFAHGFGLTGKQKSQRKRHTEDPLAHGLMRQDLVHQQGGAVCHSARTTTRTETAPLTTKRDQFFIVTGLAPNPEKTIFKPSAL